MHDVDRCELAYCQRCDDYAAQGDFAAGEAAADTRRLVYDTPDGEVIERLGEDY